MKVGRRLAIKLLNASKFVLGAARSRAARSRRAVDRGLLTMLARLVREATADLEDYNYARVLEQTETLFWFFCDNYLELVKSRRYGDHGRRGGRVGQRGAARRALGAAAAVCAVPAVRHRGSLVVVADRDRFTRAAGRRRRSCSTSLAAGEDDRGRAHAGARRRRARRHPQEEVRGSSGR